MAIKTTAIFKKSFKKLLKKDRDLIHEYEKLLNDLEKDSDLGTLLGDGRYKIRLINKANNKGKSAGYRVITYTKIEDTILLVYIYSKGDIENISEHKIDQVIINYKSDIF
ncbi:type II toxin-antitoxin system RelE/ParE family toxin [Sulfurimonas sp. MAG313]|nr:type II toxin-antitoxin system RelE/ParE family toxin [Sulfurimonas sp. MAG313]MDF1882258.1 type II toxin-antitoxin system RelE/ParE family toxin [Sulfurimonas sp. MAG313]